MVEIKIGTNDAGQRIDKFLSKKYKSMPMSLLYKYIRTKHIKANGKHVKENYMLAEGDILLLYISDEFACGKLPLMPVTKGDVDIRYEDNNIIVVSKPKGILSHSESPDDTDTLIDRITAYLIRKGEYLPEKENVFAPALCNRIDRNTEGLVIGAKNAEALRVMNEVIKKREIDKVYLAAVHGLFAEKKGKITSYLKKNSDTNTVSVSHTPKKGYIEAISEYEVISENKEKSLSLVKIRLLTGRTHQIRVQMADIGHPLLGDGKYAVNKDDRKIGFSSQALCSYSVTFSFAADAGILNYLKGKTVTADKPYFVKLFY